jgi:cytochrome c-type biogenesis protein CcmH
MAEWSKLVMTFVTTLVLCAALGLGAAHAKEATPAAADPALEARMLKIAAELRCLVCQNQTIADSPAGLSDDLRREIREQLQRGASDEQVVQYMTERYGDFIRYRPAVKGSTVALWAGPLVLLVGGVGVLVFALRRRAKLAPDRFEPDAEDDEAVEGAR